MYEEYISKQDMPEYQKMKAIRSKLPVSQRTEDIVGHLQSNQVMVITGEPGSGKSTQVPQAILDALILQHKGGDCHLICTQPRRISAIGLAERVAAERCEPLGKTVGYQVRLEAKRSKDTKLLYTYKTVHVLPYCKDIALQEYCFVESKQIPH
jgi:ATP-dependent RNA helicase DHX29